MHEQPTRFKSCTQPFFRRGGWFGRVFGRLHCDVARFRVCYTHTRGRETRDHLFPAAGSLPALEIARLPLKLARRWTIGLINRGICQRRALSCYLFSVPYFVPFFVLFSLSLSISLSFFPLSFLSFSSCTPRGQAARHLPLFFSLPSTGEPESRLVFRGCSTFNWRARYIVAGFRIGFSPRNHLSNMPAFRAEGRGVCVARGWNSSAFVRK